MIIGSGRDIVEQAAVPRFLFVDFPLGNPTGKPGDMDMQRTIVGMGLDLLERAYAPQTTVQAPFVWSEVMRELTGHDPFLELDGEFDMLETIISKDGMARLKDFLDARGVISVTERQAYIGRVRELAKGCCEAWVASRATHAAAGV